MNTSILKTEDRLDICQPLLDMVTSAGYALSPDYSYSPELPEMLCDIIIALRAEAEFKQILDASALIKAWSSKMRNEATESLALEEGEENAERASAESVHLQSIYNQMDDAFLAILEDYNMAQQATTAMGEIRKGLVAAVAQRFVRTFDATTPPCEDSSLSFLNKHLCPEEAIKPDSPVAKMIAAYNEVCGEQDWNVEAALTSEKHCVRMAMYYRYRLSVGKHFAGYYDNLSK